MGRWGATHGFEKRFSARAAVRGRPVAKRMAQFLFHYRLRHRERVYDVLIRHWGHSCIVRRAKRGRLRPDPLDGRPSSEIGFRRRFGYRTGRIPCAAVLRTASFCVCHDPEDLTDRVHGQNHRNRHQFPETGPRGSLRSCFGTGTTKATFVPVNTHCKTLRPA